MKRLFLFFAICFVNVCFANNIETPEQEEGQSARRISIFVYTSNPNYYGYRELYFDNNGNCSHSYTLSWEVQREVRYGTYDVDEANTIWITWTNGHQESADLSYDDEGNAIVYYRDRTYREYE